MARFYTPFLIFLTLCFVLVVSSPSAYKGKKPVFDKDMKKTVDAYHDKMLADIKAEQEQIAKDTADMLKKSFPEDVDKVVPDESDAERTKMAKRVQDLAKGPSAYK